MSESRSKTISFFSLVISFLVYLILSRVSSIYGYCLVSLPSMAIVSCLFLFLSIFFPSLYSGLIPWDFSLLPLRASPTIFGLLWASFQDCPLTHWLPDHYHHWVNLVHSVSSTTHAMIKSFFVWSSSLLSPLASVDKGLGLALPTSMACIRWSQLSATSFRKNAIPTRHFSQKKLWLESQNRLFHLNTKPHPLNPLIAFPPFLYWLGTSGWCSGPCVLVPLSSMFVFFHSYAISAVSCFAVSSTRAYLPQKGAWASRFALFLLIPSWASLLVWHKFLPNQFAGLLFFFLISLVPLVSFSLLVVVIGLLAHWFFTSSFGPS